ncbi:MAG: 50S ribosomal protein L23 [Bacilli bacterium]|nr:50S ribosomal protein L23 [Bacilli bacterium]
MKDYTDVILEVVVTEKSAANAEKGVYTFKVAKSANKIQIKDAIEKAFGVKVKSVNTLNTKTKKKRVGRYVGERKSYKKAIVTLKDGESLNI